MYDRTPLEVDEAVFKMLFTFLQEKEFCQHRLKFEKNRSILPNGPPESVFLTARSNAFSLVEKTANPSKGGIRYEDPWSQADKSKMLQSISVFTEILEEFGRTDPNTSSWLFNRESIPPMATSTSTLVF